MTATPAETGGAVPPVRDVPSRQEETAYLRRVFAAPARARELATELVELPELYRNLVLLRVAEQEPAVVYAAIAAARACVACSHDRHAPGDCLVALVDAGGRRYCTCGAVGT